MRRGGYGVGVGCKACKTIDFGGAGKGAGTGARGHPDPERESARGWRGGDDLATAPRRAAVARLFF